MSLPSLQVQKIDRFELESGVVLHDVEQVYTLDGALNAARDNLVIVFHSLTGDAQPRQWWAGVVGADGAIDPRRHAVLCVNLLASCYGTRWKNHDNEPAPIITTRDMAALVERLLRELEIESVALVTGGSLGGMVALEFAASFPLISRAVVSFAAPAAHTAHGIAWNHVQRQAIALAGAEGLALARMAAMISYRTADEFEARFSRHRAEDGRFQMQSYLDHQARKLLDRFDVASYRRLLDAMDSHDVGRGRGGIGNALRAFQGRLVGVGIVGDQLYADHDVSHWTHAARVEHRRIHSPHGHDAFLLQRDQVTSILRDVLADASAAAIEPLILAHAHRGTS